MARRARTLLRMALGQEVRTRSDVKLVTQRFGSGYGGWDVATAALGPDSIVYSFGVGEDATFDLALIERFGLTVHAFDPTPKSLEWVEKQGFPREFVMHGYGIAAEDGVVTFHPPENRDHVSHTMLDRPSTSDRAIEVPVKRLPTIMQELGHRTVDLLKMDIEGAEYEVLEDIEKCGVRPSLLLVEFHHRFPGVGLQKTESAIEKIRAMDYRLYSISETREEFCFIRSSSVA